MIDILKPNISLDYPVIIFGCGEWGKSLFLYLYSLKYEISAFCDNNPNLWTEKLYGAPIYAPEVCAKQFRNHMFVVACKNNADEICNQLKQLQIADSHIRIFDGNQNNVKYMRESVFLTSLNENYQVDMTLKVEQGYIALVKSFDPYNRHYRILLDQNLYEKLALKPGKDSFEYLSEFEKYYGSYRSVNKIKIYKGETNSVHLLMACCHKDKHVFERAEDSFTSAIQCGRALTDVQVCELSDDSGDNISAKNGNYCECTALYWAWKNGWAENADYIGLRHYRRRLLITEEQLQNLNANGIDMVLMEPTYVENLSAHFNKGVGGKKDWDMLRQAIKEVRPEYYEDYIKFEEQHMICQCNMFVMRRKLFDEYSEYLFSVLGWIDNCYSEVVERDDRYLGYLAESLTSLFALHNKKRLQVIYADMEIIG